MQSLKPDDAHNRDLVDRVHPSDWISPTPAERYNLVVVGGGTAGLIAALGSAGLGARVALVERHLLGGDCLVHGCVPSKGVLAAAHTAHATRHAAAMGIHAGDVSVDFAAAMERMRRIRAGISHHDSAKKLADAGVDVFFGAGRFTGTNQLAVGELTLDFARAVICTGARPMRPPIEGLDEVEVLDNEGIFELTELPERLVVICAGPIGCELGQAMSRLGSRVTLVDAAPRILPRDDADASAIVAAQLESEGVSLRLHSRVLRVAETQGTKQVVLSHDEGEETLETDAILLAVGRRPNVEGLGLDAAGVRISKQGIEVDDQLRTSNPDIYASGDVASRFQFTHAADALSRIVIQNALFLGRKRASDLVIPWATYTDPEVAHVGISLERALTRGDVQVFEVPFSDNDRSLLEGEETGFARAFTDRRGRILGATVVGRHAGEIIGPLSMAMTHEWTLNHLQQVIFPYPSRMDILKRLAGAWSRTRLTPTVATILRAWPAWRR